MYQTLFKLLDLDFPYTTNPTSAYRAIQASLLSGRLAGLPSIKNETLCSVNKRIFRSVSAQLTLDDCSASAQQTCSAIGRRMLVVY